MHTQRIDQHVAARRLEECLAGREARAFLRRSLSWELRLRELRAEATGAVVLPVAAASEAA